MVKECRGQRSIGRPCNLLEFPKNSASLLFKDRKSVLWVQKEKLGIVSEYTRRAGVLPTVSGILRACSENHRGLLIWYISILQRKGN